MTRLGRIASEIGFYNLATVGLPARCVMIGTLTAGQFFVFDIVMDITGEFGTPVGCFQCTTHRVRFDHVISHPSFAVLSQVPRSSTSTTPTRPTNLK